MAICKKCDGEFNDKRAALGYGTCLNCGERDAEMERESKQNKVAVLYNKGPYMYMDGSEDLNSLGKK